MGGLLKEGCKMVTKGPFVYIDKRVLPHH